jgi:8-oxo-dGTP pyrophosphatase MutT (NUDIX family)
MQNFHSFIEKLKSNLNGSSLPGLNAQLTMAPVTRLEEIKRRQNNGEPRQSAVLVFFYPFNGKTKLVFIKRPVDLSVHSGQVAFPGGRVEDQDVDLVATALREANEEVNVDPAKVTIVGALSKLHIPPSNFDVYPFIGFSAERPDLKGNEEVDRILEIDVEELLNPDTKTTKTIHHRLGKLVDVPCYFVENEIIWGATAMMVGELLEVIRKQERIS